MRGTGRPGAAGAGEHDDRAGTRRLTYEEFLAGPLVELLRFAAVLTGHRGATEELVRHVLLRVRRDWAGIVRDGAPEPVVRRMIVREYLSRRRRPVAGPTEGHPLLGALGALPRGQRAVLVLRHHTGLSDADIADEMLCGVGVVREQAEWAVDSPGLRGAGAGDLRAAFVVLERQAPEPSAVSGPPDGRSVLGRRAVLLAAVGLAAAAPVAAGLDGG
ncbi:MAG TPA: hypothetical protein VGD67_07315 [Pseudonocardiaceae bacterium]